MVSIKIHVSAWMMVMTLLHLMQGIMRTPHQKACRPLLPPKSSPLSVILLLVLLVAPVAQGKWAKIQVLVLWGNLLIILILPTCWMKGTPHLPPTMGQFPCCQFNKFKGSVFKLMDGMFNKKELASSSLVGGVRKDRGSTYTKQVLSPGRMKNILILRWPNLGFPLNLQGWQIPPNLEMPSTWNVARLCSKISNPCFNIQSCKKWWGTNLNFA